MGGARVEVGQPDPASRLDPKLLAERIGLGHSWILDLGLG